MYRVVAFDLDGTLLRNDKSISAETIAELQRIAKQGIILLPSTGRTHLELPEALKDLPFLRYALCCNGGAVYDYKENRYIYEEVIPHELALELLEYAKTLPVYESVVINGRRIAEGYENGEVCDYIRKHAVKGISSNITGTENIIETFSFMHADAQKFLLYLDEGKDREAVIGQIRDQFPALCVSSSGAVLIEVNIQGVDKGKALKRFCSMMNVPIEESLAFGDAENDISMLEAAGMAIVMENGSYETKKHADMICPSNEEDGVRKALEQLI